MHVCLHRTLQLCAVFASRVQLKRSAGVPEVLVTDRSAHSLGSASTASGSGEKLGPPPELEEESVAVSVRRWWRARRQGRVSARGLCVHSAGAFRRALAVTVTTQVSRWRKRANFGC